MKNMFKDYFDIGVCLKSDTMFMHGEEMIDMYNTVTVEYEMKWPHVEVQKDVYDFSKCDLIVDYCRKKNMKLRAHTVVWHQEIPNWLFEGISHLPTSEQRIYVLDRCKNFIDKLMERYGDVIYHFDIANEVVHDDNTYCYREDSPYYPLCDNDPATFEKFLAELFIYMNNKYPNVKTYYNDYHIMTNVIKRRHIINLVKNMTKYGARVDGLGLQSHLRPDIKEEQIIESYKEIRELPITEVSCTEVDCSYYQYEDRSTVECFTEHHHGMIANAYKILFNVLMQNTDLITNVTFWGLSDKGTWLNDFPVKGRGDISLLFDNDGKKKLSYDVVTSFGKK